MTNKICLLKIIVRIYKVNALRLADENKSPTASLSMWSGSKAKTHPEVIVMRRVAILLLLLVLPWAQAGGAAATLPGRVAYVRDGALWLWENGRTERLTDKRKATSPHFSADGRYLAFRADDALWVTIPRGPVWKLSDTASKAVWSPTSATLALESDGEIRLVDVGNDGPKPSRLVLKGWRGPAWSPDGRRLAVTRDHPGDRPFTGTTEIGVMPVDGGDPATIWRGPYLEDRWVGPVSSLKWSADGRWLAFYRQALSASIGADSNELNLLAVAGGSPVAVAIGPANPDYFAWSPAGATLAFTDGAGRFAWLQKRIQVASMPPKPPFQSLTPAGMADREPAWDPTGRSLYLVRSLARAPARMDQPGPEQAIWRWRGQMSKVAGTEGALGLRVGREGWLLYPRAAGAEAALWATQGGEPVRVIDRMKPAGFYYGQFDWSAVFDWSARPHSMQP